MSHCSPVAGNETGITTFQLDIKSEGLTLETLERALLQVCTVRVCVNVCAVYAYVCVCVCVCGNIAYDDVCNRHSPTPENGLYFFDHGILSTSSLYLPLLSLLDIIIFSYIPLFTFTTSGEKGPTFHIGRHEGRAVRAKKDEGHHP
jgi:hypothetical protein